MQNKYVEIKAPIEKKRKEKEKEKKEEDILKKKKKKKMACNFAKTEVIEEI